MHSSSPLLAIAAKETEMRLSAVSGNGSEVRAGSSYGFEVEFTPN